jgi:hypothetical protein
MLLFVAVLPVFAMTPRLVLGRQAFQLRRNWIDFLKMSAAMLGAGIGLLIYRYALQFGDRARGFHALPSLDELIQTLISVSYYIAYPLTAPPSDGLSLLMGAILAVATCLALYCLPNSGDKVRFPKNSFFAVVFLGLAMTVLGLTPYILAQLGRERGDWVFEERILSSAGYGIILLLAAPAGLLSWKPARLASVFLTSALAGLWLAFGFGLRVDWSEAADRNCRLWTSLLEQVPYAENDTVFLFYDLNEGSSRAVVFGGQDPLFVLMKMLYQNKERAEHIYAYQLYGNQEAERFQATVTPQGFSNPFSLFHNRGPVPQERLILVRRRGDRLVVEDSFTSEDPIGINWQGTDRLNTNRKRILPVPPGTPNVAQRLAKLSIRCTP